MDGSLSNWAFVQGSLIMTILLGQGFIIFLLLLLNIDKEKF